MIERNDEIPRFAALRRSRPAAYRDEPRRAGHRPIPLLMIPGLGAISGSMLLMVSGPDMFLGIAPALFMTATILFACGHLLRAALLESRAATFSRAQPEPPIDLAKMFAFSVYGGNFSGHLEKRLNTHRLQTGVIWFGVNLTAVYFDRTYLA